MKKLLGLWLFVFAGMIVSCSSPPECTVDQDCLPGYSCSLGKCRCFSPRALCAGSICIDLLTSNVHCGRCGQTCTGGQTCQVGTCQCDVGQSLCDGSCVDIRNNKEHCGACGNVCSGKQRCASGVCRQACPEKTPTICDGGCIDTTSNARHCGSCGKACPEGRQCLGGNCECPDGQNLCGDVCVNTQTSSQHCGSCNKTCKSGQLCASGRCVGSCPKSTPKVCFGGCVDTKTNRSHCGGCGQSCGKGKVCVNQACQCPAEQKDCSGECVNIRTDQRHCGGCGQLCPSGQVCSGGRCVQSCPQATEAKCFGGCFDLKTSPQHCGKCGEVCKGFQRCINGECKCPTGFEFCDGQCVRTAIHPNHCGKCGTSCPAGEFCAEGSCVAQCPGSTQPCYGGCLDLSNTPEHCGACGNSCGANRTCRDGQCACPGERTVCSNTCVNLQTDALHCGECGKACQPGQVCKKGQCQLNCAQNEEVCGKVCVDTQVNKQHCGTCGTVCGGRKECVGGKCNCPKGFVDCDGICVNTDTDVQHCGGCKKTCAAGEICEKGGCKPNCVSGQSICNNACVYTQVNRNHCGACDNACPTGASCQQGKCVCPTNRTTCNNVCVNTSSDPSHCGGCGKACPTGQRCNNGSCELCPSTSPQCGSNCCPKSFTCCNNQACVNLQSSNQHCGACGNACSSGQLCCNGKCVSILNDSNNCGTCNSACSSGESCCLGTCTKTDNSSAHCGACGNICASGQSCCGGSCKDLQQDKSHCGTCGVTCKAGEGCCGGKCLGLNTNNQHCGTCGNVCKAGDTCCDGGCINLLTTAANCGACGKPCPIGQFCSGGQCQKTWAVSGGAVRLTGEDRVYSIARDGNDNLYIFGHFQSSIQLGSVNLSSLNNGKNLYVAQLDTQLKVKWAVKIESQDAFASDVATDASGNVYVTGHFRSKATFGTTSLTTSSLSSSVRNVFVGKLSNAGKWLWVKRAGGNRATQAQSISLDSTGNIYIGGYSNDTSIVFGSSTLVSPNGYYQAFVAKMDTSGNWKWGVQARSDRNHYAFHIATDKQGNTAISGYFERTIRFDSSTMASKGGQDAFVAVVDTNGKWKWFRSIGGISSDYGRGVAFDSKGDVYVAGYFNSRPITIAGSTYVGRGSVDAFVAKYDKAGVPKWAALGGGTSVDQVYGLSIDSKDNLYVHGSYSGSTSFGSFAITSKGSYDTFTAKLNTSGQWLAVQGGGSSSSNEVAYDSVVDSKGNVYVTGHFYSKGTFGSVTVGNNSQTTDVFVVKYNANGTALNGVAYSSSESPDDYGFDIATDSKGNVYVTGYFAGNLVLGSTTLQSPNTNTAGFVAKLSNAGAWQWAKSFGGQSITQARGIAVDSDDNVYLTGHFLSTFSMGTSAFRSKGSYDVYVAKLDSSGNVQWVLQAGGTRADYAYGITTYKNKGVYITGQYDTNFFFGNSTLQGTGVRQNMFIARLDTRGLWSWARGGGGAGSEQGLGVATDALGDVYVTGSYTGTATFGTFSLAGKAGKDIFVAKLKQGGSWAWVQSAGSTSEDEGWDLVVDKAGNVYVTGIAHSNTAKFGNLSFTGKGAQDVFVAQLDQAGVWKWVTSGGSSSNEQSYGIDIDANNNLYVTGRANQNATFGTSNFSNVNYNNGMFVAKMSDKGVWEWASMPLPTQSNGTVVGRRISVDKNGKIFTVGSFSGQVRFDSNTLQSNGRLDLFIWQVAPPK